IWNLIL
ncbi:hypothetical protein E2320_010245, partial [Naja naja]